MHKKTFYSLNKKSIANNLSFDCYLFYQSLTSLSKAKALWQKCRVNIFLGSILSLQMNCKKIVIFKFLDPSYCCRFTHVFLLSDHHWEGFTATLLIINHILWIYSTIVFINSLYNNKENTKTLHFYDLLCFCSYH